MNETEKKGHPRSRTESQRKEYYRNNFAGVKNTKPELEPAKLTFGEATKIGPKLIARHLGDCLSMPKAEAIRLGHMKKEFA